MKERWRQKKAILKRRFNLLQAAIDLEDQLNYNEPPDWFFSIRHHLGSILIEQGAFEQAETLYQKDLKLFPETGWALQGLYEALVAQGKDKEAKAVKVRFQKAWQWADVQLKGSSVIL